MSHIIPGVANWSESELDILIQNQVVDDAKHPDSFLLVPESHYIQIQQCVYRTTLSVINGTGPS